MAGSYTQRGKTWSVRYYDATGTQRRKGGFRTRGDAEKWYRQRMREQDSGVTHDDRMTVGQLVDRFLDTHHASEERVTSLRFRLAHAAPLDDKRIASLKPHDLEVWRSSLPTENTRHDAFAALKQALEKAVLWKLIPENPAKGIKNPAPQASEMYPIPDWETVLELEAEMEEHYKGWLVAQVGTGLRPQEWPKLRVEHVDLASHALRLPVQIVKPKTPARIVPLRASAAQAFEQIIGQRKSGLVFQTPDGYPVDIRNWRRRVWQAAIDSVNEDRAKQGREPLPHMRPYDTRHTYATWGLRAGLNTFMLAKRMGTSLKMIDKTYGHFARDGEDHERALLDAYDLASMPVAKPVDLPVVLPARGLEPSTTYSVAKAVQVATIESAFASK
jgi:integrase